MGDNNSLVITVPEATDLRWRGNKEAEKQYWEKHSIHKLQPWVTVLNKMAYTPWVVRFGPYHHDNIDLKPMEEQKERVVHRFLKRTETMSMGSCIGYLMAVAQDLMDAYDSLDHKWKENPSDFLELMVRDGCFMLELLRYYDGQGTDEYAHNDPIFSDHGMFHMMPKFRRDMILLENQLPILLLINLLSIEHLSQDNYRYLIGLILKFFFPAYPSSIPMNELYDCKHVLDIYRKMLLCRGDDARHHRVGVFSPAFPSGALRDEKNIILPSADWLHNAKIKIRASRTTRINDFSFEYGVLRVPSLIVDEVMTEPLFLNLLAFERCKVGIGNDVTSYVSFMAEIIKDERDVKCLNALDIVQNSICDKAVASLFNALSFGIGVEPGSRLAAVRQGVYLYSRRPWMVWSAHLKITYFHDPWVILLRVAGFCFFVLTLIQTIYTIGQYDLQRNSSN